MNTLASNMKDVVKQFRKIKINFYQRQQQPKNIFCTVRLILKPIWIMPP